MRAIPGCGLQPVAGKTSCSRIGTTSLFENDRPHGGLLQRLWVGIARVAGSYRKCVRRSGPCPRSRGRGFGGSSDQRSCRWSGILRAPAVDRPHGGLLQRFFGLGSPAWRAPTGNAFVGAGHARDPRPGASAGRPISARAGDLASPALPPACLRLPRPPRSLPATRRPRFSIESRLSVRPLSARPGSCASA